MRFASTRNTGEASSTSPWWRSFVTSTRRTEAGLIASGTTARRYLNDARHDIKCRDGRSQPAGVPEALGAKGRGPGARGRIEGLWLDLELPRVLRRLGVRRARHVRGQGGGRGRRPRALDRAPAGR